MHTGPLLRAVFLVAMAGGCGKEHPGRGGPRDAEPLVPVAAVASDAWTAGDERQHCAALRDIAGATRVVPAWTPDAASPLDAPSGFASCEPVSRIVGRHNAGSPWYEGIECVAPEAPSEAAASARLNELAAVWRRCLASSGLLESMAPPHARRVDFRKPSPPSSSMACALHARGSTLHMACYRSGND